MKWWGEGKRETERHTFNCTVNNIGYTDTKEKTNKQSPRW